MAMIPFGEQFPYTNMHDLNLDWIIRMVKELNEKFESAISSKIKVADPIQWDITKQYESLTIVVNDNTAYLSTKPVPSGTAITNEDYWQQVFDMTELEEMIEQVAEDLNEKYNDLDEITVKNNSAKELLYIGDSYSTMSDGRLFTEFVSRVGIPSSQIHNAAVSGSGFVSDGVNTFLAIAQNYAGDKEAITDILIAGGINDALLSLNEADSATVLETAINNFKTYCDTNYPNAKIHLAYIGGCLADSEYFTALHPAKSQEWALWAYTTFARGHGYNVLKTYNAIHTSRYNYSSDKLHPSASVGMPVLAEVMASAFNGSEIIENRPRNVISIPKTGVGDSTVYAFFEIINDVVNINIPDCYVQIANGQSIDANDYYAILSLTGSNTLPTIRGSHYYTLPAIIRGFTGIDHKLITVSMKIENGTIYIKPLSPNNNNQYETLTASTFSIITFSGIGPITLPIWDIN